MIFGRISLHWDPEAVACEPGFKASQGLRAPSGRLSGDRGERRAESGERGRCANCRNCARSTEENLSPSPKAPQSTPEPAEPAPAEPAEPTAPEPAPAMPKAMLETRPRRARGGSGVRLDTRQSKRTCCKETFPQWPWRPLS